MIKLFFLITFLLTGGYSLRADEVPGNDQEFVNELDSIKSPFDNGIPIPQPVIIKKPVFYHRTYKRPKRVHRAVDLTWITLPPLHLQGVIVGEDVHQAIINDEIVPVRGVISGARVESVSKEGVELFFKGKKFFLKVD